MSVVALRADTEAAESARLTDYWDRMGPIAPLLRDDAVSEVMVNGHEIVCVERNGRIERTGVQFTDEIQLLETIQHIVGSVGRRIDADTPLCDARLTDGSRVNAVIRPLAVDGPLLTIRKFAADPLGVDDLIRFGTINQEIAALLRAAVLAKCNIVVSGGTGSGKTTLLNILSSFIPDHERIVTIEDAAELQLQQWHVCRLESRQADAMGRGGVPIRQLVANSLRMRPDRVVIGECRGPEALDMLQAMNTGHSGSLTTLHANSSRDALSRLETLILMGDVELPQRAIRQQIASAVNLIVQVERLRDGSRKVTAVTELLGLEADMVTLQDAFVYVPESTDAEGKIRGTFRASGIRPAILDKLAAAGVPVPAELASVYPTRGGW